MWKGVFGTEGAFEGIERGTMERKCEFGKLRRGEEVRRGEFDGG